MPTDSSVGVLGLGYLGEALMKSREWCSDSWASSRHENDPSKYRGRFHVFHFKWENKGTWKNIPDSKVPLVVTIPPVVKNPAGEQLRLRVWCDWMRLNRSQITEVVYISTTGVYPNLPKRWQESDLICPDTNQGRLRLETERILSLSFNTIILRAGAIYGPGRHIGRRILKNKLVPKGKQPVHRIHVLDLANITAMALLSRGFPRIVNAVDLDSSPSEEVAQWIVESKLYEEDPQLNLQEGGYLRKKTSQNPDRRVDNQVLMNKVGYKFQYPTFKEGLRQAINRNQLQTIL